MPRKKEINFWNSGKTWGGFALIFLGLFLLFIITGIISSGPGGIGRVIFFGFMVFLFFTGGVLLMPSGEGECYYCQKKITNFCNRIVVKWPEKTEYSGKEAWVCEQMHLSCHRTAEEKFKIPDPKFALIDI